MSLSFNKNSNPVLTPDLVKILEDKNAFNTMNAKVGATLEDCENFFYVLDKNQNKVGFVFFKQNDSELEILFGKYEVDVKGFADYILKNIKELLQQINLESFSDVQIMNVIKVNNHHFDHLLNVAYLNGFKGQCDFSQGQVKSMAQKMRQDPEYGESVTLLKNFSLR